jgi:hypothetical protein
MSRHQRENGWQNPEEEAGSSHSSFPVSIATHRQSAVRREMSMSLLDLSKQMGHSNDPIRTMLRY